MARPIWSGTLGFGLLNIPVALMPGERQLDPQFRMLDARDNQRIRYERVNAETGEEVPWKDVVKAFEYDKGSYVVLDEDEIRAAQPQGRETVAVEAFVAAAAVDPRYFEKPYVLVPARKAEKGYVLLRETLRASDRIGIARVVIRTREYLAAVMPHEDALVLVLLRWPQELIDPADYALPAGTDADYRISARERQMAQQLIDSMAGDWAPDSYHDEFRERLEALLRQRIEAKGGTAAVEEAPATPADATTNVVDFMSLLRKSLDANKRTPARKTAARAVVKKTPAAKAARAPARKPPAKKAAKAAAKAAGKSARAAPAPARKAAGRRKTG